MSPDVSRVFLSQVLLSVKANRSNIAAGRTNKTQMHPAVVMNNENTLAGCVLLKTTSHVTESLTQRVLLLPPFHANVWEDAKFFWLGRVP